MDACVLIDFWGADPSLIQSLSREFGPIHIAADVFAEIRGVDRARFESLGGLVTEPNVGEAAIAADPVPGLSLPDRLCLVIAEHRGWVCVTNDARLRSACDRRGVAVCWGYELLADGVDANCLSKREAITLAHLMARNNAMLRGRPLEGFLARVEGS